MSTELPFEDAPCGLLVMSADGTILAVNRTLCGWLGFSAAELIGKKHLQDLLTMGAKIFHQTHWMPLLQMQGSVAEVQLDLLDCNGRTLPALVNAVSRREGSETSFVLAVFLAADRRKFERELIAEKKRAEALLESERRSQEALRLAQARLQLAEQDAHRRALFAEELIGIVSHDLRTPLQVVSIGTNLLLVDEVPAQQRTLSRMASSSARASRLISDLLDLTQARLGGGLAVQRREIDLHAVVADAVEELRAGWPGRMIEHRKTGEGTAAADPDRLLQVVTNLVNNALTYGTSERPVTVTSSVSPTACALQVHNWGPPIPPELRDHLFEPMRRGEQQVKLGSRSVGLGLYIVQQIAEAHGGKIQVESATETGTSFTLTLFRASVDKEA